MGDLHALVGVIVDERRRSSARAIVVFSSRFAKHATAAAGISATSIRQRRRADAFRPTTPASMLRRKEWTLLRRDPWLVSQTLMQVLYLLPPALLLWRNFGDDGDTLVVLVPVFVMAAGQLAGGLAWLAVSGEDAPDLVATAPISGRNVLRAKLEAVIGAIALVLSPVVARARLELALLRAGRERRHPGRRRLGHGHPALVPQAGEAEPVPPPADLLARRHLRGSVLVDLVGGDRRPRGRGDLVCAGRRP